PPTLVRPGARMSVRGRYPLACWALLLAASPAAQAGLPDDAGRKEAALGEPVALYVRPDAVTLVGPRALQQLVVTGRYADGSVRDLPPLCSLTSEAADVASVSAGGLVMPHKQGPTTLRVTAAGRSVRVPVAVTDFDKPRPVSFRHDVMAALGVGGC